MQRKLIKKDKKSEAEETETETETETENTASATTPPSVRRTPSKNNQRDPGEKFAPNTDTKTRIIWTLIMVFGFILIISMGHMYIVGLVFLLNLLIFKEILQLKRRREKEHTIPYFHFLNWYFFMVTWYFLSVRWLGPRLQMLSLSHPIVEYATSSHAFKSFALYMIGFVTFVASLEKGLYRYQFRLFAWSHMTLLFVVCQSSVMIVNIFDGIIWFFLGTGLVIWNDIFAFVFGRWLGKTPLIKLSPKKTWEGFIGAFITTVMFSILLSWIISFWPQLVCPQEDLTLRPFVMPACTPSHVFQPRVFQVPIWLGGFQFEAKPIIFHAMALSVFASVIAPFGGFFASGFKRAFKIKDFGDSIPGHGGITDRMDCQIIMSLFVYVYRITFLRHNPLSVTGILSQVALMTVEQQLQLHQKLTEALTERGLLA